jgi:hypothetical protein
MAGSGEVKNSMYGRPLFLVAALRNLWFMVDMLGYDLRRKLRVNYAGK